MIKNSKSITCTWFVVLDWKFTTNNSQILRILIPVSWLNHRLNKYRSYQRSNFTIGMICEYTSYRKNVGYQSEICNWSLDTQSKQTELETIDKGWNLTSLNFKAVNNLKNL